MELDVREIERERERERELLIVAAVASSITTVAKNYSFVLLVDASVVRKCSSIVLTHLQLPLHLINYGYWTVPNSIYLAILLREFPNCFEEQEQLVMLLGYLFCLLKK